VALIVVSGAPGTGKSTIAAALGAALRFPVLSLDPVKEALADILGLGGEDWSNRVGDAAAEVVFRLAAAFPDAVAEGWWRGARRARIHGPSRRSVRFLVEAVVAAGARVAVHWWQNRTEVRANGSQDRRETEAHSRTRGYHS